MKTITHAFCAATLVVLAGIGGAAAQERQSTTNGASAPLPAFEVTGMPITPHQVAVLGSGQVEERAPAATLTLGGMPASPHQLAVLAPRSRVITTAAAANPNSAAQ